MYNKFENDTNNAYLYDVTTGTAGHEHNDPDYNMQIVCHIKEENNANRSNLIDMGVF